MKPNLPGITLSLLTYTLALTVGLLTACGGGGGGGGGAQQTPAALKLPNDTGITAAQCYQAGSDVLVSCTSTNARALNPAQDGMLGRDANAASNSTADGNLGFSFTKIDASGAALPASATTWSCVKDNITGLIWEVKTVDGGLHDASKTFTNYDSTTALQINGTVAPLQSEIDAATNAVGFKNAVNSATLCGASDWRLPTPDELQSIVDYSVAMPGPTIDANWFPNTQGNYFLSSSPHVGYPIFAWEVDFSAGVVYVQDRTNHNYVRLVRASQ